MEIERRYFDLIEIRAEDENGKPKMVGHAAVFNREADLGWFREKVSPGAFSESIQEDDVRALWNHDQNFVLGRNKAGTLVLFEDEKGLAVSIDPPDTQFARDLQVSMQRGDVTQMSFGFQVIKESWESRDDGNDLRTLERVKLWDVSPVTFPAYPQTDIAVRSHDAWLKENKVPDPVERISLNIKRNRLNLKSKED